MNKLKKPRSLELFFVDGDPDGMLTATVPFQWSGHVLLSSRTQLREALKRPEASRPGVYLLIGESETGALLYIGEGDDISQRIKNHDAKKEWWSTAIFITSSGDQLNKAHARYLESRLIEKAKQVNKIALENGTAPTLPSLSEAALAHMEDFLENIYLVLPALKFDFFLESTRGANVAQKAENTADKPIFTLSSSRLGINATAHIEDSHFVVEVGSKARAEWVGDTSPKVHYNKLYAELVAQGILVSEGSHRIFTQSYAFTSPSAAGSVVAGRSTNGTTEWKLKDSSKTYKEWEQEQLAKDPSLYEGVL
jgi:hypothetical protein